MIGLFAKLLCDAETVGEQSFAEELRFFKKKLSKKDVENLYQQFALINKKKLSHQKKLLLYPEKKERVLFKPVKTPLKQEQIIADPSCLQNAASFLVAGGQGTRLGFSGPKGCYLIDLINKKSLFQLHAERVIVASKKAGKPLPLAIMTSPLNHEETVAFFDHHCNFGLEPEQLDLFMQSTLPFLDEKGAIFCEKIDRIAVGSDGNGAAFYSLVRSGVAKKWRDLGVRHVTFSQVDNPLSDPFDPSFVSEHAKNNFDVTMRVVKRKDPEESVGIVVQKEGIIQVAEYTEVSDVIRYGVGETGGLLYPYANISNFCFSLDFMEKVAAKDLPLHLVYKKIGRIGNPDFKGWKFESFIFDCLLFATKVQLILTPRRHCFAPLKDKKGKYGPQSVQKALSFFFAS